MSCTGNTQWYVCTKGDFKGCCSSDPCGTGICPDSGSSSASDSSSTSTTTTTTKSGHREKASTTPTTASRSLESTYSSSSSSSTPSSTQISTTSSETAAETGGSTMMDMHGDSSMHNYHERLIAGVITGSVIALLLLVGMLLWVWYRSRKKRGKGFTLLEWYGVRYGRQRNAHSHGHGHGCGRGCGISCGHVKSRRIRGACTCDKPPATPAIPGQMDVDTTNTPVSNTSVHMGNTVTPDSAPRFLMHSPPSAISSPERQLQPYQRAAAAAAATPQPLETIPSPTLIYQQNRDKRRRQKTTTPELGDTGFYRPRVELATHSQSELINVPPRERTRRNHHSPIPGPSPSPNNHGHGHGHSHGYRAAAQPEHIVTSDGAVLAANFRGLSPGARDHATSFADVPLGLGFDFACTDQDLMRRADAVADDQDVLPAYSEHFNNAGKN